MANSKDISRLRAQRDNALTTALAAAGQVRALDAAIIRAQRAGQKEKVVQLQELRAAADRTAKNAQAEHSRFGAGAFGSLVQWLEQTPEQVVGALNDELPFVLLPVRMETKFA